jgi:hypothetical protein
MCEVYVSRHHPRVRKAHVQAVEVFGWFDNDGRAGKIGDFIRVGG